MDPQDDLEFALIQMKAETAKKISDALLRLEEGTYGLCFECGEQIAQPRLRALPFALRCKDCETPSSRHSNDIVLRLVGRRRS